MRRSLRKTFFRPEVLITPSQLTERAQWGVADSSRFKSQITLSGRGFCYAVSGFGQVLTRLAKRRIYCAASANSRQKYCIA